MEARLIQRPDHPEELDHRARPAVGEHERERIRVARAGVQEVDAEPVDRRAELPDPVQPGLDPAPVVPIGPVRAQRLQFLEGNALRRIRRRLRPPRRTQPRPKIVQVELGNREVERRDVVDRHAIILARLDGAVEADS